MMFGYRNQQPWDVFSGARFENARKLLGMLHASRATHAATRRPIIFVANNLGGLLVKQVCFSPPRTIDLARTARG